MDSSLFTTPSLDHISLEDYSRVYEPDQDSFLFLDALEEEYSFLQTLHPSLLLEIGPGTGIISSFLSRLLNKSNPVATIAIDINLDACVITKQTYQQNSIPFTDVIRSNLLQCIGERLKNAVDIIIFNPPYVPTSSEETFLPSIESAYAGGIRGREVIDVLLPNVSSILSQGGVFYLLLEQVNNPEEVTSILERTGLKGKLVLRKQCRGEELMIMKYTKE
ncbi:hypothetical protein WA171_007281 [Blastocystis sp. BT1]